PKDTENQPLSQEALLSLLCGGKVSLNKLFNEETYADIEPKDISLAEDDEVFEAHCIAVGDDASLLRKAKALYDWALLEDILNGNDLISKAKVETFNQHKHDLALLKRIVRTYLPERYSDIFNAYDKGKDNYTAYVQNAKKSSAQKIRNGDGKRADKKTFSVWLKKQLQISPDTLSASDQSVFDDIMVRLDQERFLPKQVQEDNRVIPYQIYYYELRKILDAAQTSFAFLNKISDGYTVAEKILQIFTFRIPYFIGPLVDNRWSRFAWMVRKAEGKILPWNFEEKVDLDKSEEAFIRRMTNQCTYLPGENVLPATSLLYQRFAVLNEINLIRINGVPLVAEDKQAIVTECFETKKKTTRKQIEAFLKARGVLHEGDIFSGLDIEIKSTLSSFHQLKPFLTTHKLTQDEAEIIIERFTFSEDKKRRKDWLLKTFENRFSDEDLKKLIKCQFKDFGRLSRAFLEELTFEARATGQTGNVMDFLWNESVNLMMLLSASDYTLSDKLNETTKTYYTDSECPHTLEAKMDAAYLSSAVKRQVYRALDVMKSIRKVMGCDPKRIFVEMARGEDPKKKVKRTKSRTETLRDLYQSIDGEDVRLIAERLAEMGDAANSKLQSRALYLWYLQLGKCPYCGQTMHIETLKEFCDIDHIIPQSKLKDDSLQNNCVLAHKTCNGEKTDVYPIPQKFRQPLLWKTWHDRGLITKEKYQRLMRTAALTDAEKQGFINRQLVETQQTTKAVFHLLQDLFPKTEIVSVKAGLVSDYRHEFNLLKTRSINDLHHAKDAYLNIVVGNVYHEKFTRRFNFNEHYSLKTKTIFEHEVRVDNRLIWQGKESINLTQKVIRQNDAALTKYAYYAKGGLFDQMPVKAGAGQIPLKADPTHQHLEKYGAYNKAASYGFLPVAFTVKSGKKEKRDILILPLDLAQRSVFERNESAAIEDYVFRAISNIIGKTPNAISFPLGLRIWKVGTCLQLDNLRFTIRGKSGGGTMLLLGLMTPMILSHDQETYIKHVDTFLKKKKTNKNRTINSDYDSLSAEGNLSCYDALVTKLTNAPFDKIPASQATLLNKPATREAFIDCTLEEQVDVIAQLVALGKTNRAGGCDLTKLGGVPKAGVLTLGTKVSNWAKSYKTVHLIDSDAAHLYVKKSRNLLAYL
ncbi:MAG: type II CRISPR RNA-guided endonuclease Cas9, partial [Kiritimatiellae bacterium]|nr:type II CRISPR RNA-guided endonuclease Cas9 [Kiritimatiellia bacterium]